MTLRNPQALYILRNVEKFKNSIKIHFFYSRNCCKFQQFSRKQFAQKRLFNWCCIYIYQLRKALRLYKNDSIRANFFWDISVRFLSWEWGDFWRRHHHFRRFPKKSEVFRRRPKSAEGEVIEKTLFHKITDREEGIVIYSFYTWFSFLTWVWVNIFLEIVSSKTATTHIFQSDVRNWPASVRSKFSTRRRESWQVYRTRSEINIFFKTSEF